MRIIANKQVNDFTVKLFIAAFFAEISVVAGHHFSMILTDFHVLGYDLSDHRLTDWLTRFVIYSRFSAGPTVFLLISGFLFYTGFDAPGAYRRKLRSRMKSLGLPYLLWNFVASPWFIAIILSVAGLFMTVGESPRLDSPLHIFFGYYPDFFPSNAALWFIQQLLVMVVLSPLIWFLLRRAALYYLLAVFLTWTYVITFVGGGGIENFLQALLGFSVGGWLSLRGKGLFNIPAKIGWLALAATAAVSAIAIIFDFPEESIRCICCILAAVAIMGLTEYFSHTRLAYLFAWLGEAAIFFYFTHLLYRAEVSRFLIRTFNPSTDLEVAALIVFNFLLLIIYIMGTFLMLRNLAPRLLRFFLGGRSRDKFALKK